MGTNEKKEQFTEIYEREVHALYRYVFLRISQKDEVLDIVQDTFMKFWLAMNKGAEIRSPRSFIFTIARNRIIDWYRKKKHYSLEEITETEEGMGFEIPDEELYRGMNLSAEAAVVLKAVDGLPPQYREAVYLRFVESLSPSEIAEVLGITANAASVRISRGMEELRKKLKIETD